jgi:FtsP/CotA-like multicopper oxidase with cupredoxin domain
MSQSTRVTIFYVIAMLLALTMSMMAITTTSAAALRALPEATPNADATAGVSSYTLTYDVLRAFDADGSGVFSFNTRAYNGDFCGPLLRVRAGQTLRILLRNQLTADDAATMHTDARMNTLHAPNTTNLHTHGMHVSPEGVADDIFRAVDGGTEFQYEYDVPADHPPGMAWYHPHLHGSSAFQVMGGAAGVLLVDEAVGATTTTSLVVRDMPETVVMFQHVMLDDPLNEGHAFAVISSTIGDTLPMQLAMTTDASTDAAARDATGRRVYMLVNGQLKPTIEIAVNTWHRVRAVNAAAVTFVDWAIDGGGCEMYVLAHDGVLRATPALITHALFAPGNRMDVAVRCTSTGTHTLSSARRGDPTIGRQSYVFEGVFASLSVVAAAAAVPTTEQTLTASTVLSTPPTFLKSLTNAALSVASATELKTTHTMSTTRVPPGRIRTNWGIDSVKFDGSIQHTITLGALEQWAFTNPMYGGGFNHPMHVHVNHMQVVQGSLWSVLDGQWVDTVPLGAATTYVRFRAHLFTGKTVAHCHVLTHEDYGMMQAFQIDAGEVTDVLPPPSVLAPPDSSSSALSTGAVVGIVAGLVTMVGGIMLWWYMRRRCRTDDAAGSDVDSTTAVGMTPSRMPEGERLM